LFIVCWQVSFSRRASMILFSQGNLHSMSYDLMRIFFNIKNSLTWLPARHGIYRHAIQELKPFVDSYTYLISSKISNLDLYLSLEANYSYFHKNATWVFRSLFSAQYFRLTETNKGQDFDIFLQIKVQIL
jgi:hypothetical protein